MQHGRAYLDCITREAAERLWMETVSQAGYYKDLPTVNLPVDDSLGRVAARAVYAEQSVPHYNGAAMDGIAVRSRDTFGVSEMNPRRLKLAEMNESLAEGCAMVVDTGDCLPQSADAVIMIEDVHIDGDEVELMAAAAPWQHVRVIGEDIVIHELVITEGQLIGAAHVAAMVAAGVERVDVLAKPRVAIIPTGTEIVATKGELAPGKILDVNSHMLAAAVKEWGGTPVCHAIVADDFPALLSAARKALADCDMLVMLAGTSAGTEDFTAKVLGELGTVAVHGVAIKPGKPVVLATADGKPVIGLPGYPVSAMLTAELFIRPVLSARQNLPVVAAKTEEAMTVRPLFSQVGVEEFIRVSLGQVGGKTVAAPLGRGAGLISSLTKAQGIMAIEPAADGLAAGTCANVRLFDNYGSGKNLLAVGSHDLSLELMAIHLKRRGRILTCANVGSMGGVMAIKNGECHMAGVHLLDEETGVYNVAAVRRYLQGVPWRLVHLGQREQGLMVARDNPLAINTVEDLFRPEVLFVNRQRGAGTRMLLDYRIKQLGLDARGVRGYDREASTHMAVAAAVAAGAADVGMGIRAAATALNLEFVSVGFEQYDLLVNFDDESDFELLLEILQSSAFRAEVEALGGYDLSEAGRIVASAAEEV